MAAICHCCKSVFIKGLKQWISRLLKLCISSAKYIFVSISKWRLADPLRNSFNFCNFDAPKFSRVLYNLKLIQMFSFDTADNRLSDLKLIHMFSFDRTKFIWEPLNFFCSRIKRIMWKLSDQMWIRNDTWNSVSRNSTLILMFYLPRCYTEAYSEPKQTSKMDLLKKIINDWQPLTIFAKNSILDIRLGFDWVYWIFDMYIVRTDRI